MSAVAKVAAVVVGAVAIVASGGLGAGLALAVTSTLGVGAATISAVATGLSIVSALTAPKPGASPATGSQTSFSANPDDGHPLIVGRTGTGGKIIYRKGFDTRDDGDNDRNAFVAALSLGPVASIVGQTVDKVPVEYDSTGNAIGAYRNYMWSRTQLGATPEASALDFGVGAGTPPGWTAAHKLSGKAAATWTLRFDTKAKLYQGGVPAPLWIVKGALCYDPTKDSTYPGGSGPHRWADPSDRAAYDAASDTWEWTENPYLVALHWAHGFWQRDRSDPNSQYQRIMGIGAPMALIDTASFVEGRNIAAAAGWTCGGEIYSTDGKWETMKRLLQAGMGEPIALGARISCLVNAPKVSLATIGIDDVVGTARVPATQPRRDRINTITPRYRLEANNWQYLPGTPITVPEYVAADKGKRSKLIDYQFIQDTKQIATAVRYDIENAREFGPISLPLKLYWLGYKPGDCVTADLPELGLNGQPLLLLNRQLGAASGIVTMTARSETNAKHAYALGQTTTPPPTPGITGQPIIPQPPEGAWTLAALPAGGALVSPTIAVNGSCDATVDAVSFEYRVFDSGAVWTADGSDAPTATRREITGLRAGTQYEVAIRYLRNGIAGVPRVIGPVTTATVSVKGDPGASAFTLRTLSKAVITSPTSVKKEPDDAVAWDSGAATAQAYAAAATSARVRGHGMIGLAVAPDGGFGAVDYGLHRQAGGGLYLCVAGAFTQLGSETATAEDILGVGSDGRTVSFSRNGIVLTTRPCTTTQPLFGAYCMASGSIDTIAFASGGVAGRDGLNGSNGLPGSAGTDGRTTYVHFAFANSADGQADFTTGDAGGRFYIGTYTDFTETDSSNPATYAWSKWRGADGANGTPGSAGADGRTTYVHIAYASSANGQTNFSTTDPSGRSYIGTLTDYTLADSTNPADYVWSLVKGADGTNAVDISVAASEQAIKYNAADQIVTGPVTITTARKNTNDPVRIVLMADDGQIFGVNNGQISEFTSNWPGIFSSTGPDNMTIDAGWLNTLLQGHGGSLRITTSAGGASDVVTLVKVKDGSTGQPGADGIGLIPSPATFVIPALSDGTSKPSWTGGSCRIALIKGGAEVAADSYGYESVTNIASIALSGQTITFANATDDKAEFTATATKGSATYRVRVPVTRARDGSAAFSSSTTFSGGGNLSGQASTTVPAGRTVTLSSSSSYNAGGNAASSPKNGQGRLTLYWRNSTDNGSWQLLGSQDGSIATSTNRGTVEEPNYDIVAGAVAASFSFTSPAPDKLIDYRADFSVIAGAAANVSGRVRLEVTA